MSCVGLTKVVGRPVPFHRTVDALPKFVPVTVSLKGASPSFALVGDMEATLGGGVMAPVP